LGNKVANKLSLNSAEEDIKRKPITPKAAEEPEHEQHLFGTL